MPDKTLHDILHEVLAATDALQELINRDYATRKEVEENFTNKRDSWKKFWLGMLVLAMTIPLSFAATFTTLSACFLTQNPISVCHVIPGFDQSQERNRIIFKEFRQLQEITQENDRRITELEEQSGTRN